jgi:hypothetical protein
MAEVKIYHCPIPGCPWAHVSMAGQAEQPGALADVFGWGVVAASARQQRLADVERTLNDHLNSHTILEWVTGIGQLQDALAFVAKDLADDGRIGHALLNGAMMTRANLPRRQGLDRIRALLPGEALASEADRG